MDTQGNVSSWGIGCQDAKDIKKALLPIIGSILQERE
jgi:hypothetical protein